MGRRSFSGEFVGIRPWVDLVHRVSLLVARRCRALVFLVKPISLLGG